MRYSTSKISLLIFVVILATFLSSCHSTKKNVKNDNYEMSNDYNSSFNDFWGLKITKKDNHKLYKELKSWMGVPYQYGGNSRTGTDCSGLVMVVYDNVYNIKLARNSAKIMELNCRKINRNELKEGDLIFFTINKNKDRINHVGLYLKENKFVHSSSSKGVIISDLGEPYYQRYFYCAGRVKQ